MVTTIDASGRVVIPKRLRDELCFVPGQRLDVQAIDGRLVIEHSVTPMRLEKRGRRLVGVVDRQMPELTSELVRETLEQIRR